MQRSMKEFRVACELVRNGAIGKIDRVECSFGPPGIPCDLPEEAMEPGLDWNMWIGPGPMRPYSSVLSPRGMHDHFPRLAVVQGVRRRHGVRLGRPSPRHRAMGLGDGIVADRTRFIRLRIPTATIGAVLHYKKGIKVHPHERLRCRVLRRRRRGQCEPREIRVSGATARSWRVGLSARTAVPWNPPLSASRKSSWPTRKRSSTRAGTTSRTSWSASRAREQADHQRRSRRPQRDVLPPDEPSVLQPRGHQMEAQNACVSHAHGGQPEWLTRDYRIPWKRIDEA